MSETLKRIRTRTSIHLRHVWQHRILEDRGFGKCDGFPLVKNINVLAVTCRLLETLGAEDSQRVRTGDSSVVKDFAENPRFRYCIIKYAAHIISSILEVLVTKCALSFDRQIQVNLRNIYL